ncbi:MAG: N-6 DNA methylase [Lachnospiraceae bacterium]|nr:N-6 DNA methylase [Lachnospiraceae bacterium]
MSYESIIRKYLEALQNEYKAAERGGQHTAELSYRPVLDMFIRNLAREFNKEDSCDIVLEPKNQGTAGRPDWRIHDKNTLGIYGYIEAKGFSEEPFDIRPYEKQIEKYRTLGHKLVITDGIDYLYCPNDGAVPIVISLVEKSDLPKKQWSRLKINQKFMLLAQNLFSNPSPRYCNENELVEQVALRTRWLSDDILHYAEIKADEAVNEDETQAVELLAGIRNLVYAHNDRGLRTEKVFADFTSQVIMFSLLYAHRVFCTDQDSPIEKEWKIRNYISDDLAESGTLRPFRNLMVYLRDNAGTNAFISQKVDECIKFLSFVQMTDEQLENPDYHQLFELFLTKYDAQVRFDYGAYYTPKILANFVVGLTNTIAENTFSGTSIYDAGNTIIDPCCGTGSFLEELVLHDSKNETYNLCGFEILPAPYMLANYRMALINRQFHDRKHNINILLANTLSNSVLGEIIEDDTIEGYEQRKANELASLPIKLIIGNPPCSDSIRENITQDFSIINELMEDFRPPVEERHGRSNVQKQVSNPYMQFVRWSCEKLLSTQNHAILSFVVPLSFLEAESYKYARKYIVERFSNVWVIEVDADARTGARSNGLFKTLQGRAVIILTHKFEENEGVNTYYHLDISRYDRAQKDEMLKKDKEEILALFAEYEISLDTYSFIPAKSFNEVLYNKFWTISGETGQKAIFKQHCSGIKLAPTAIFTHNKKSMLKRRSKEIAQRGVEAAHEWLSKQDRPPKDDKIIAFQNALKNCGGIDDIDLLMEKSIQTYAFRPFMTSNVLLWKELLQSYKAGGGGTRLRPEIVTAFEDKETIGFAMAHAPKDLNPTLSQFASFCWYYPDNDMCTRGNSHIYMNQYVLGKDGKLQGNIDDSLCERVGKLINKDAKTVAKELVFYVYAILCSQVYLDEFEGALFTVNQSDKRARVPIVDNVEIFNCLCGLGRELAELEKADYKPENLLEFDYESIKMQIPKGFHLINSVHPFDEESEKLILTDGKIEIKISCPIELQKLNISGYDVVKNVWLKFNSYNFTHCDFSGEDVVRLLDFLNTLVTHRTLIGKIDDVVMRIVSNKVDFIEP